MFDDAFTFLAFDDEDWTLLAHGETASSALLAARNVAPNVKIEVVEAGSFGRVFWDRAIELAAAEAALQRGRNALELLRPNRLARAQQGLH